MWQETFHLVTATNLPTSGVQDNKFEETLSVEARCVASLGFAYHDCEGAELMMLMTMLRLGLCLIGVMTRLKPAMTAMASHYFLRGGANMGRVFTPSQKVVAALPQNASACESVRKSALNSKCAGTHR